MVFRFVALWLFSLSLVKAATVEGAWRETRWNDERAHVATAGEWEAIVSTDRGRLVYFGKAGGADNLLFAPTARKAREGWGGHAVWLGPQTSWTENWPPPRAWEASAAASAIIEDDRLVLTMPDAGEDWPRLVRVYRWFEGRLHCEARVSGGTRDAQIIHVMRVPSDWVVDLEAKASEETPQGYVQLHLGRTPDPMRRFEEPPQVSRTKAGVTLRHTNQMEKVGFTPQPIVARRGAMRLVVDRGRSEGPFVGAIPDEGFVTQVYLGSGRSPLIELEQLSPLWAAANDALFEIILEARIVEETE